MFCVYLTVSKGKRIKRYFNSLSDAKAFLSTYKAASKNATQELLEYSSSQIDDIRRALRILPQNTSLFDVVSAYVKNLPNVNIPLPDAFISYKKHLEMLNNGIEPYIRISSFFDEFKDWNEATPNAVMDWLLARGAPKTVREARSALNKFYEFSKRRGFTSCNPCDYIALADLPRIQRAEVGIWEIDSLKLFFEFLEKNNRDRVNFFAVSCFAGIRRATVERLSAKNFDIKNRRLTLPYKDVKTGETWLLEDLPENFWAWIDKYGTDFKVLHNKPFNNLRKKFADLHLEKLGRKWKWKDNICRHSFATYHLSLYRDMIKTAHILCHRNPNTMWQHYLAGLIPAEEASKYFQIRPTTSQET